MATSIDSKEDVDHDPIEAEYDVYIKPQFPNGRQLYVLQFPNRSSTQPYTEADEAKPTELRIKPKSGLMELDVPMDAFNNFDRDKALKWGDALRYSQENKIQYGLPGAFGIGAQPAGRGRGRGVKEELEDTGGMSDPKFLAMLQQNRIMKTLTLGGAEGPAESWHPQHMIGVFRENTLHLVPIKSIIQLRPQFHHIDAKADLDKQARPRDPAAGPPPAARAVHMTAKSTIDGEEARGNPLFDLLKATQEESWRKLRFIDEESAEAWANYEDLFVNTEPQTDEIVQEGEDVKPKIHPAKEGVAQLQSSMSNADYLDYISAPRDMAKLKRAKRKNKPTKREGGDGSQSTVTLVDDDM